ncbi:Hypothetical protein SMAX5B_005167 [Scophthalmus maximus]|uniref:Uncharacterized protein n=1 Tax=Scophthalmus maximus TaxID=52904 RepID=A0A2U9BEW8_SCOMX|nr:Hypothetical protein SMAX5B_005167 [Scophthalmus maximus]
MERHLFRQPRSFKDTLRLSLRSRLPILFSSSLVFPLHLSPSELSLAEAPEGSIILEHLSAVCLHRGSSAATGATGK